MKNQETSPLFLKWLQESRSDKLTGLTDTPVMIEKSFKNLQNPLEYLRDDKINKLQKQAQNIRNQIKQQKQATVEFSKTNYKKLVSRDNVEYNFGKKITLDPNTDVLYEFRIHSDKKEDFQLREKEIKKKQKLAKKFVHSYQQIVDQKQRENRMTFDIIKEIDSKDFYEKYQGIEFSELFNRQIDQKENQKYSNPYEDIADNYELDDILTKNYLPLVDKDSFYGEKSEQILYKAEEQMDFWKRINLNNSNESQDDRFDEEEVMKRIEKFDIQDPSYNSFLDFAVGRIGSQILDYFFKKRKKQETQMKLQQNDEDLEQQYNKKKAEYELLKQLRIKDKNQKIAVKYINNAAQTIDILDQKSFDSYFQGNCKDLLRSLEHLNQTRQKVLKSKQQKNLKRTMLANICYEIKNILFEILCMLLVGEDFPEFNQYMCLEDKNLAERKILESIYLNFSKFKIVEVEGVTKAKLIDIYLKQRQKNEKIFQILGRMIDVKKKNAKNQLLSKSNNKDKSRNQNQKPISIKK